MLSFYSFFYCFDWFFFLPIWRIKIYIIMMTMMFICFHASSFFQTTNLEWPFYLHESICPDANYLPSGLGCFQWKQTYINPLCIGFRNDNKLTNFYCSLLLTAGTTKEHLGFALALAVPTFVVVTKIDMVRAVQVERTLNQLERLLKGPGCRKIPIRVESEDDAVTAATNFTSERFGLHIWIGFCLNLILWIGLFNSLKNSNSDKHILSKYLV